MLNNIALNLTFCYKYRTIGKAKKAREAAKSPKPSYLNNAALSLHMLNSNQKKRRPSDFTSKQLDVVSFKII